jgi:hypothetical protein
MVPTDPNAKLNRIDTASALTAAGYPITSATLATFASRDVGPDYTVFGGRAVYRWGDTLQWARARATPSRRRSMDQAEPAHAA